MTLRSLRTPMLVTLLVASVGSAWWGCSAGSDTETSGFGDTSTTKSTTGTASANGGAGGTSGSTDGAGGLIVSGPGGSGQGGQDTCVSTNAVTELVPLDMLIVLDESGSMSGAKWDGSTQALKTFIGDPASDGVSVGIVYFPVDSIDDCNYLDYENLNVPIAPLPGNAAALVASIDSEAPQGGTPTYGALKGALYVATGYQDANPTHKVIVVFASDGDPTSCAQTDIPTIAALAKSAYNYNGVQTYTIYMAGATKANIDAIAAAGGTVQSYDVSANIQQFAQKMKDIQAAALSCEFIIPPPPQGEEVDPTLVNVEYTPGGMGNPQKIPKADNLGDCGSGPGWYYDNEAMPTKILLCPASCQTIKADGKANVEVAFGCKSKMN